MAERNQNSRRRMQTHQRIGAAIVAGGLAVLGVSIPAGAQVIEGEDPLLCAFVFDDANGNGTWEPGEVPLSFVQIELGSGVEPFGYIESGVTNADGLVCFAVEAGVPYKLKEFNPPGFVSTTPDSVYPFVLEPGEDFVHDFGDWIPVTPSVSVEPSVVPTSPSTAASTTAASTTVATTAASTTVATTAASTTVATTAPALVITTTSLLTTPTVLPSSAAPLTTRTALTGTLPATGGESDLALVGAGMIVIGGLMSAVRRKPAG